MNLPFARYATVNLKPRGIIALAVMLTCGVAAGYDDRLDDIMYQDPGFPSVTVRTEFADDLKPLWLRALARPEAELQRLAADTIALAHRASMPGLDEAADRLLVLLQQDELEPTVRRAVANALVTLDAKQAAEPFAASMARGSSEMLRIVEPALARWNYEPARTIWRERLDDPNTERSRLQLAIECLGTVKDADASPALLRIVKDVNGEVSLRLCAARAAAEINQTDVLAAANELATAETDQPTASLLAATLLARQNGPEAISILKPLAEFESAPIRGLVLQRLFEIDPTLVDEFSAAAVRSTDVNIRRVGSAALAHRADADSIGLLGPLLDDANPGLRRSVSDALLRLAEQESLRDAVVQATTEVVSRDAWRGLEQGIIVLAKLDHEPAAPRLVELLTHRRPEVAVTAAWGLRKLAVADTFPALLAQAERQATLIFEGTFEPRYVESIDLQLSQLFQTFGQFGYVEAEPLMRKFIPKTFLYFGSARPAAVWSIGKLHDGKVEEKLAAQLAARLSDTMSMLPEIESVRRMSAIGIGCMKADSQLSVLRRFVIELPSIPGQACAWSLGRMTGETFEFSLDAILGTADWFLTPYRVPRPIETD